MKSIYPWATVPHLAEEFAPKLQAQCVQTHYRIPYKSILSFFNGLLYCKTFNLKKLVKSQQQYENSNVKALYGSF
jgi:hypothetical protein